MKKCLTYSPENTVVLLCSAVSELIIFNYIILEPVFFIIKPC